MTMTTFRLRMMTIAAAFMVLLAAPMSAQQIGSPQTVTVVDSGTACSVASACAVFTVGNAISVTLDVSGTWTGTLTFEATVTGGTYNAVQVTNLATGALVSTTTASGSFAFPNTGVVGIRARATATVTGTAFVAATKGFLTAKHLQLPFGAGSGSYTPSGVLSVQLTPVSNVSTSETDLMTYSLPANSLNVNGKGVRITVWLTTAANANTKTSKVYFGGTVLRSRSAADNNILFVYQAEVYRTGAATQSANATFANPTDAGWSATSPTETLSGAVIIKVTGQSATGSNDLTATMMKVEAMP